MSPIIPNNYDINGQRKAERKIKVTEGNGYLRRAGEDVIRNESDKYIKMLFWMNDLIYLNI